MGEGLFFSQEMKQDFLRQSESIIFCNNRKCFLNCYFALNVSLTSVSTSKNISDQH